MDLAMMFLQSTVQNAADGLTTAGIIFLVVCWSIVFIVTGYCFYKVFKTGNKL